MDEELSTKEMSIERSRKRLKSSIDKDWFITDRMSVDFGGICENAYIKNDFEAIYMRDMGRGVYSILDIMNSDVQTIELGSCSDLIKQLICRDLSMSKHYNIDHVLIEWTKMLCLHGRLIFEIESLYSKDENVEFKFILRRLDLTKCTLKSNEVVYKVSNDNGEQRKISIPRKKCVVIDFPSGLGGYSEFIKVRDKVSALGDKLPQALVYAGGDITEHVNVWEHNFNNYVRKWGNRSVKGCTDFYQCLNLLRFHKSSLLCLLSCINGLKQFVDCFNEKFDESVSFSIKSSRCNIDLLENIEAKFDRGEMSIEKLREYIFNIKSDVKI